MGTRRSDRQRSHEVLNANKPTGYTTVLKLMQIMREKGLVERDDANKAHIFRAAIAQTETQQSLVADLIERAFRGSALKLVQHVLEAKPSSAEDLRAIRRMISEAETKGEIKKHCHRLRRPRCRRLHRRQ